MACRQEYRQGDRICWWRNQTDPHFEVALNRSPWVDLLENRIRSDRISVLEGEDVLGRDKQTIQLGASNANFFEQLFDHMFESTVILGPDDDPRNFQFDALIEPSIEGFEFSTPNQTQSDAFSVWIRYRINIFDSAGNRASSWSVSAYGKSQKEGITGSDSLRRAAVLAMRDAAALIIMQMDKATKISSLANGGVAEPGVDTAVPL